MNCDDFRLRIPEYLAGRLDGDAADDIGRHNEHCPSCAGELAEMRVMWGRLDTLDAETPDTGARLRFDAMVEANGGTFAGTGRDAGSPRPHPVRPWYSIHPAYQALAAAACVMVGIGIGMHVGPGDRVDELNSRMARLESRVTESLFDQSSALARIEGLGLSRQVTTPDKEFLSVLLLTLNTDTDVNVRLAAVDALKHFSTTSWIRTELVESLARQPSPLVQVALIDLLADLGEERAVDTFRVIMNDQRYLEPVKQRAKTAIQYIL